MRSLAGILIGLVLVLAASAEARTTDGVSLSITWRAAEVEGRILWISERSASLQLDERTQLQIGWQRFVAKGKVRTNRFSTSARWYGVERLLQQGDDRQLALSWRRLEGGEGVADVAEGLFTYVSPRIDTTGLLYTQRSGGWTTGYRFSYSRTQAGTERADTVALLVNALSAREASWQVQLEAGIYADRHGDTTYRSVLGATVRFPIGSGLHIHLGATFAPQGFPLAGTPVEGLSAFAVYRPGSLVESWRDRPAGYLYLSIAAQR